jgi:CDP-diacylglycerol--glycerol-3-phosphate 3-phosphatidyltransferase
VFRLVPRTLPQSITEPLGRLLARTGLTPNAITIIGFAGALGAAVLIARGQFLAGGIVMLAAAALDTMDGLLARATGRVTAFGGVLDSLFDRLSEAAALGGVLFFYANRGDLEESVLAFAAVVGSLLVSYMRARAEAAGLELREGLFTRPERVIVLGIGLIIDQVRIALWILAVLANLTVFERLFAVWMRWRAETAAERPAAQQGARREH